MLERDGKLYYSTKEASEKLGVKQTSIGDAIWRGALAATEFPDILRRKFVEVGELERYGREHKGRSGWAKRKRPGYQPNTVSAGYQRAYRERKRKKDEATDTEKDKGED